MKTLEIVGYVWIALMIAPIVYCMWNAGKGGRDY